MVKKVFGAKQITHLLYGFVVLLPLMAIFGRTLYTIANKNAKDSYSGIQQSEYKQVDLDYHTNDLNSNNDIILGNYYMFYDDYINYDYIQNYMRQTQEFELVLSLISGDIICDIDDVSIDDVSGYLYNSELEICLGYDYINVLSGFDTTLAISCLSIQLNNCVFLIHYFNDETNALYSFLLPNDIYYTNVIKDVELVSLDNAFEYSISQFTKDNNLGGVDFFSWFTNMFLNQNNPTNALYLNFVNWYLNYTLLVSSGYLLFLVLIWFVNYIRRILDKSMNHDLGGF